MSVAAVLKHTTQSHWKRLLMWGIATAIAFQVFMMAALILRFWALPNYITFYDWPGNVWTIIQSTPSWRDMGPIIAEEWLLEIGRMNYDYGTGISEWSLNVVPSRMAVLCVLGALVALVPQLMRDDTCDPTTSKGAKVATGFGAGLVAMTNATMSWVVCCATPSWVVGLSMLGLGVSTSLALEKTGSLLTFAGFGTLLFVIVALAWRKARQHRDLMPEAHHA